MEQLGLFSLAGPATREDIHELVRKLQQTCQDCRLGVVVHPHNPGLVWRGNLLGKIAVISEAPGDNEMKSGLPLVGKSGQMWEKWAEYAGINTKTDCFITNVIQCQPSLVKDPKTGHSSQRAPMDDEIHACFGPRCLRILRAMPNLEVVLTLGWVAAGCILGGEPKAKSHENKWFVTSILPKVAVYCMVHPAYFLREPSQDKSEKIKRGLDQFRREYLATGKVVAIARGEENQQCP